MTPNASNRLNNFSDPLLRDPDAAKYLNVSIPWLQRQRWLGTGPVFVRIGARAVRYRLSDLQRWVEDGSNRPVGRSGCGSAK